MNLFMLLRNEMSPFQNHSESRSTLFISLAATLNELMIRYTVSPQIPNVFTNPFESVLVAINSSIRYVSWGYSRIHKLTAKRKNFSWSFDGRQSYNQQNRENLSFYYQLRISDAVPKTLISE